MQHLTDFIFESQYSSGVETHSNKERKEVLVKYLKHKKLPDYIETLNQMLEDPKTKTLIEDGFGGELGDTTLRYSVVEIPVRNLRPTQSEIDVESSIKWSLKTPNNLDAAFSNNSKKIIIHNTPVVTFRKNYIIDGHHRWSQVFAMNPDATMLCFNYDGDISPIQMIKAVQGSIAAVKAERNDKDGIPVREVHGQNLFDKKWGKDKIIKYVVDNIDDSVVKEFPKFVKDCNTKEKIAEYFAENLMELKTNNYPEEGAPNRGDMPVTTHAGKDKDSKQSALPTSDGSALNKLKDDKFVKNAVK